MTTEITGINEVLRNLDKLEQNVRRGALRGMNQWSDETMTLAKERTPVDTGTLRASGYVTTPQDNGSSIEQELGFGGAAADYALVQHERLDFNHPTGQAKFLESAVNDRERELISSIEREIKGEL